MFLTELDSHYILLYFQEINFVLSPSLLLNILNFTADPKRWPSTPGPQLRASLLILINALKATHYS